MAAMSVRNNKPENSQLDQLQEILREMFQSNFYGSVEVKFENGKVTIVRKTQSLKI
ncbi:hypothetical protein [Limisalsivibrio acetivorans]|uniref:hypothetical protein n=1 Tax=Limisalsivibrio acetivorans TaxID=1304888 RepID=UPI0003B49523|nr:hypothetical protein [Limisalsivibrio acetivorans]